MTYNHVEYITKAINSALYQQTSFEFEIVIGEDYSIDGTREIVLNYQKQFPHKIKISDNTRNLGMVPNFLYTLNQCSGKYVALLEGDDEWLSENKLQTQVFFLEQNPEYSISCHNALITYEKIKGLNQPFNKKIDTLTLSDVIREWNIPTASIVFRRSKFIIPDWFTEIQNWDYALQILLAKNGKVHYLKEIKSIYRKHPGGNSFNPTFSLVKTLNRLIELFDHVKKEIPELYLMEIEKRQKHLNKEIIRMEWIEKHRFLYAINPYHLIRRSLNYLKYRIIAKLKILN